MGNLQDGVANAKAWYQSKTIFGVVFAFIPTILRFINPELVLDLDGVVADGFEAAETVAVAGDHVWATAMEVVGALIAIWGRVKAKVKLK